MSDMHRAIPGSGPATGSLFPMDTTMRFEIGDNLDLLPLDPWHDPPAIEQALDHLEAAWHAIVSVAVPDLEAPAQGGRDRTVVERVTTLSRLVRWLRLSTETPSGLRGLTVACLESAPVVGPGTWCEVGRNGAPVWLWTRLPGEESIRALCLEGLHVRFSAFAVLPGHRPRWRNMVTADYQDGCWRTDNPDLVLAPRPGEELEIWDPAVTSEGEPVVFEVLETGGGLRLRPSRPMVVRFVGLGMPRVVRQSVRVTCSAAQGDAQRVNILHDGTIDFGEGVLITRVPADVRIAIEAEVRLDGRDQEVRYECRVPVATAMSRPTLLAGDQPLPYIPVVSETSRALCAIDGLRLDSPTLPPASIDLVLRRLEGPEKAGVTLRLESFAGHRAVFRDPTLGATLAARFPVPSVVQLEVASQGEIGQVAVTTATLSGRWLPRQSGALVFRSEDPSLRLERLEYPSAGYDGRTLWLPVGDLEDTPSAVYRGRCAMPGRSRFSVALPLEPAETGVLRLISPSEAPGPYWSRSSSPSVEFLVPPLPSYTARAWIPPFGWEDVPCEPTRNCVRVYLPRHLLEGMSGTVTRFWIGTEDHPFRWQGWCPNPRRPTGDWWPCARHDDTVLVPEGQLLVDFYGLIAGANLADAVNTQGKSHHLLLLDNPWDTTGLGDIGKDGASVAPLQAAVTLERTNGAAHYWLQALDRGPALLHLKVEPHGAGWAILPPPATRDDVLDTTLHRLNPAPGHGAWEIHPVWAGEFRGDVCPLEWDGRLFGLVPPPDPTVLFLGWTWPEGSRRTFQHGTRREPYGFVAVRDKVSRPPSRGATSEASPTPPSREPPVRLWIRRVAHVGPATTGRVRHD